MADDAFERVHDIIGRLERSADPAVLGDARELVAALLEMHRLGLDRLLDHIRRHDGEDGRLAAALADDEVVAHLLMVHGLHPVPLERRATEALREVDDHLAARGARAVVLGLEGGRVRVRLHAEATDPEPTRIVEEALLRRAPDLAGVEIEGRTGPALVQLRRRREA